MGLKIERIKRIANILGMSLSFFIVSIFLIVYFSNCSIKETIRINKYSSYKEGEYCVIGMPLLRDPYRIEEDYADCLNEHAAYYGRILDQKKYQPVVNRGFRK